MVPTGRSSRLEVTASHGHHIANAFQPPSACSPPAVRRPGDRYGFLRACAEEPGRQVPAAAQLGDAPIRQRESDIDHLRQGELRSPRATGRRRGRSPLEDTRLPWTKRPAGDRSYRSLLFLTTNFAPDIGEYISLIGRPWAWGIGFKPARGGAATALGGANRSGGSLCCGVFSSDAPFRKSDGTEPWQWRLCLPAAVGVPWIG
ncbi:hypothetical protein DFJ74DRAFT_694187 [Hyaloraphidium curvatum]|nr:hypothetical protein DFJ74DRAFT_694187 [Hyaloraphidium curvatum]